MALQTRLALVDAADRKREIAEKGAADTSETLSGKRGRASVVASEDSEMSIGNQDESCRLRDLHLVYVVDKEVAEGHAQCLAPDLKARWDATHASAAAGVRAQISERIAQECNPVQRQELSEEERDTLRRGPATAAKEKELHDWQKSTAV